MYPILWQQSCSSHHTLSTLARTCRVLRPFALKALEERYEATFKEPLVKISFRSSRQRHSWEKIRTIRMLACRSESYLSDTDREVRLIKIDRLTLPDTSREILLEGIENLPAHVELALLLLGTPNLTTLCVQPASKDLRNEENVLPLWLTAVISSMPMVSGLMEPNHIFSRLHTLRISMGGTFSLDLAWLFHILTLRILLLSNLWIDRDEGDLRNWRVQNSAQTSKTSSSKTSASNRPAHSHESYQAAKRYQAARSACATTNLWASQRSTGPRS